MVRGRFFSGQDDLTEILKIRKRVFQEELQIDAAVEEDGQDAYCMHVLGFEGDKPTAIGRISFDGWDFVISRVAVLPEYRGQKLGDFIVRMLIDKAMMSNAKEIQLEAFEENIPFFETIGFKAVESTGMLGNKTLIKMVLDTDSIHKCCNCK